VDAVTQIRIIRCVWVRTRALVTVRHPRSYSTTETTALTFLTVLLFTRNPETGSNNAACKNVTVTVNLSLCLIKNHPENL
jgi:hypothetical protein